MSRAPAKIGMAPPRPGAFIREEILEELGLTVSEAAKVLDVRRATLSDLVNGNTALSAEMALRIEKASGVRMETLLKYAGMPRPLHYAPTTVGTTRSERSWAKTALPPPVQWFCAAYLRKSVACCPSPSRSTGLSLSSLAGRGLGRGATSDAIVGLT
jgi:antitoxin HigA-1